MLLLSNCLTPILNLIAGGEKMALQITSSAFSEGGMIPRPYTCDDKDVSPDFDRNSRLSCIPALRILRSVVDHAIRPN